MESYIKIYENVIPDDFCKKCIDLIDNTTNLQVQDFNWRKCQIYPNFDQHYYYPEFKQFIKKVLDMYKSEVKNGNLNFITHIEAPNIIRYRPNEDNHFHTHADNWNESTATRQLSIIVYLNDVEEGGGTFFPEYNLRVQPKKGSVVVFPSFYTYLHTGERPISNNKYIIVSWLHYSAEKYFYRTNVL